MRTCNERRIPGHGGTRTSATPAAGIRPWGTQIRIRRAQLERTARGDIDDGQEQSPGKGDAERDRHGRGERRL